MASSVTEGHIKRLRKAGYLSSDIAHRLPDKGQLIPTPRPHERVMFLTHFLRGLGFPLHPFVWGLMFYYGLDFHDLAPNFILNISAFIIVCEAFLHCRRSRNGGPKTCLHVARGVAPPVAQCGPSSSANTQDPRGVDDTRPHRAGSRGRRRDQGKGYLTRFP